MKKESIPTEQIGDFLAIYATKKVPLMKQLMLVRQLMHKTQGEIARAMQVTPSAICLIEAAKRGSTIKMLEKYCEALDLRVVLMPRRGQS